MSTRSSFIQDEIKRINFDILFVYPVLYITLSEYNSFVYKVIDKVTIWIRSVSLVLAGLSDYTGTTTTRKRGCTRSKIVYVICVSTVNIDNYFNKMSMIFSSSRASHLGITTLTL